MLTSGLRKMLKKFLIEILVHVFFDQQFFLLFRLFSFDLDKFKPYYYIGLKAAFCAV